MAEGASGGAGGLGQGSWLLQAFPRKAGRDAAAALLQCARSG